MTRERTRSFISKGYLTDSGLTRGSSTVQPPPLRFGIVNTLNVFPLTGVWDYATDFLHQELRISDRGSCLWWDPVDVPVGKTISFVTYAGLGRADHGMSRIYLNGQRDSLNSNDPSVQFSTKGFIGAVETPFAIALTNGNSDLNSFGQPNLINLQAFMQNMYHDPSVPSIPNASAFVQLPDGLTLSPDGQQNPIQYGNIARLSTGQDEGQGQLNLQATGVEAGLLPVKVTFNDGFSDSATAVRRVNVPQGRLYQFGDDYHFVTFPFTYNANQDDPAAVLGLQSGSFQLKQWNPQTLDYEDVDRVQPGHGYWIRLLGQGTSFVRLSSRPSRSSRGRLRTRSCPCTNGWNQVGNPSPYTVPCATSSSNSRKRLREVRTRRKTRNLIRFGVYLYNPKTGQYGNAPHRRTTWCRRARRCGSSRTVSRRCCGRLPSGRSSRLPRNANISERMDGAGSRPGLTGRGSRSLEQENDDEDGFPSLIAAGLS